MVRSRLTKDPATEELLAALTDAAYRVVLTRGLSGSFLDVELEIWKALRAVLTPQHEDEPCAR
jgi:hypothetical protein